MIAEENHSSVQPMANPASAAMAGFQVVNISSTEGGYVDVEELKKWLVKIRQDLC